MKLFLLSINHRKSPLEVREKASIADISSKLLSKLYEEAKVSEAAICETCNRSEVYLYASAELDCRKIFCDLLRAYDGATAELWHDHAELLTGQDVVRHIFRVSAGLESAILGENQVLSQVKKTYKEARDCRTSHFLFHRLFHYAFRVGKRVRTKTDISRGAVSVAMAAVELASCELDMGESAVMVVGAGDNGKLVADYVWKKNVRQLIITNRNSDKAKLIANKYSGAEVIGIGAIAQNIVKADAVISTTGATEHIVKASELKEALSVREKPLVIIDIAVPRDIDPATGDFKCVKLFNIDDVTEKIERNHQQRALNVEKAEAIVDDFVERFMGWYKSLDIVPVIAELNRKNLSLARFEAKRYACEFSPDEHKKLELFAESLTKKILHNPISFLKQADALDQGYQKLEAADFIKKIFTLDQKD
jgi:glutamyl-tRNA reductase